MKDDQLLDRIVLNQKIMVGKPVIRGTRLTVDFILNLLAHGATEKEILDEYKGLTQDDIRACFLFATKALKETEFMPLEAESPSDGCEDAFSADSRTGIGLLIPGQ